MFSLCGLLLVKLTIVVKTAPIVVKSCLIGISTAPLLSYTAVGRLCTFPVDSNNTHLMGSLKAHSTSSTWNNTEHTVDITYYLTLWFLF